MSKYVKDLITNDVKHRLDGVEDCVLVNVIGLDANTTVALRKRLREKEIGLLVVKNSLAKRATADTPLANAFANAKGANAVCWGAEDFVSLVKEVAELHKSEDFEQFSARGGVMDGEELSADRVLEISKWPSRQEQLSLLSGQILGPGRNLAAQLIGPGGQLASQIEKKGSEDE